jgi:hypothetical protein
LEIPGPNEHWSYRGSHSPEGHPVVPIANGSTASGSRVMLAIFEQRPIEASEQVRRTCEQFGCLNPRHLKIPYRALPPARARLKKKKRKRKPHEPQTAPVVKEFNDLQRLYARVNKREDGCWTDIRPSAVQPHGSKTIRYRGKTFSLRRLLYALHSGEPLQREQYLHPNCGTSLCLNPEHMDCNEHILPLPGNGLGFQDGHCRRGHDLSVVGVYTYKRYDRPNGSRRRRACRKCVLDAQRRYRAAKKEA